LFARPAKKSGPDRESRTQLSSPHCEEVGTPSSWVRQLAECWDCNRRSSSACSRKVRQPIRHSCALRAICQTPAAWLEPAAAAASRRTRARTSFFLAFRLSLAAHQLPRINELPLGPRLLSSAWRWWLRWPSSLRVCSQIGTHRAQSIHLFASAVACSFLCVLSCRSDLRRTSPTQHAAASASRGFGLRSNLRTSFSPTLAHSRTCRIELNVKQQWSET
jgi:hypothetical protein